MKRPFGATGSAAVASKVALSMLLLFTFAAAQDATPISASEVKYRKKLFKNDQVAVFLLDIPPKNASVMHRHDTDLLTIFFEGGKTKGTILSREPKVDTFAVGDVRYRPPGFTHLTENIGDTDFRAVIMEFMSPVGPVERSMPANKNGCESTSGLVCSEKYVLCATKFCVVDVSLAPGASWTNDLYANGAFLVAVSDARLSGKAKDRALKNHSLKVGQVEHVAGGRIWEWKNVAKSPTRFIAVVFRS